MEQCKDYVHFKYINKYKYPLMESQCDGDYVQNMVWSGGHENNKKDKNDV